MRLSASATNGSPQPAYVCRRHCTQNTQFWPKPFEQFLVNGSGLFALRAHAEGGANYLREGDEVFEGTRDRWLVLFRAVSQALDAMQHTDRQLTAADRTTPLGL